MKVPFNWLSEFVDLGNISPEQAAAELSLKAFEVEDIEWVGAKLQGPLVSGKILEIEKHPKADKLQITKILYPLAPLKGGNSEVEGEQTEIKQIVCGARNMEVGQIVPVALPGSIVINRTNGEALPIKLGKIRDIESQGMLCSASELGIESTSDGIWILPIDTPIGIDLIEKLNLKAKAVLNIESRSNRGDALCLQGIAREAAATFDSELKLDYYKKNFESAFDQLAKSTNSFRSIIENSNYCAEIGFLKIKNVKIAPSPEWLSEKLKLAGISSINNVVDITNYVMLEIGQPMHAYDAKKLDLSIGISVKSPGYESKELALDSKEYRIDSHNLGIYDSQKIISIAGVMGLEASSIKVDTTEILFEAGCFTSQAVRLSSRRSGIATESSRRFERGTDPKLAKIALMRAAELVKELAGGEIEAYSYSKEQCKSKESIITLRLSEFKRIIGQDIEPNKAKNILKKLGFTVNSLNESEIEVLIPSFRQRDILRPIDLIEELARFMGLNTIEPKPLPGVQKFLKEQDFKGNLKNSLIQQGYTECISSSLVPDDLNLNKYSHSPIQDKTSSSRVIKMKNPLSRDHSALRTSLIPGLLKAISLNFKRQGNFIKFFEIGKIYESLDKPSILNEEQEKKETYSKETEKICFIASAKGKSLDYQGDKNFKGDFTELKGIVELLCSSKGKVNFSPIKKELESQIQNNNFIHPQISSSIELNGRHLGIIGQIHPLTAKEWEMSEQTYFVELLLSPINKPSKVKIKAINDNPSLNRDFTIDFLQSDFLAQNNLDISHKAIEKVVSESKFSNLEEFKLINIFEKKETLANSTQISYSYRLVFRPSDGISLSSDEINNKVAEFKNKLKKQIPVISFRE
jgi:phenylalanyl-tRNA synthetase beta chain